MRRMQWLLGASLGTAAVALVVVACGGSTNDNPGGPQDSGTPDTAKPDTSPPVDAADAAPPEDAACVPDSSIGAVNLPDAAIDDAGASIGRCVACGEAKCSDGVAACNKDCQCVKDLTGFLSCMGGGGSLLQCGGPLVSGADDTEKAATQCFALTCGDECGIHLNPQQDSGTPSDASADAPSDAPSSD